MPNIAKHCQTATRLLEIFCDLFRHGVFGQDQASQGKVSSGRVITEGLAEARSIRAGGCLVRQGDARYVSLCLGSLMRGMVRWGLSGFWKSPMVFAGVRFVRAVMSGMAKYGLARRCWICHGLLWRGLESLREWPKPVRFWRVIMFGTVGHGKARRVLDRRGGLSYVAASYVLARQGRFWDALGVAEPCSIQG